MKRFRSQSSKGRFLSMTAEREAAIAAAMDAIAGRLPAPPHLAVARPRPALSGHAPHAHMATPPSADHAPTFSGHAQRLQSHAPFRRPCSTLAWPRPTLSGHAPNVRKAPPRPSSTPSQLRLAPPIPGSPAPLLPPQPRPSSCLRPGS